MKKWLWFAAALVVAVAVVGGWRVIGTRRAQQVAAPQAVQPLVELAPSDVVRAATRDLQRGLPVSGSL